MVEKNSKGITLIALIITIIILLILAGVAIATLTGENGILSKADTAKITTEEQQAKEKLELLLLELGIDKRTDSNYNEMKYINDRLTTNGIQVEENIATVDGWKFTIDRSVPKIGERLGNGETNITIQNIDIWNKEQMNNFRNKVNQGDSYENKTVRVKANIDLENEQWEPIGTESTSFKGIFDGENHIIKNLYINSNTGNQALFRKNDGTIKNLTLKGEVTGNGINVAGVCAITTGTMENITNYVNVTNNSTTEITTAGIVATLTGSLNSYIKNCKNYGNIVSECYHVAGVVGSTEKKDFLIDGCENYGKITSDKLHASGILDKAFIEGTIQNCINEGEITSKSYCSGGILGEYVDGTKPIVIKNCINKGKVQAENYAVGGIVGNVTTIINISECKNEGEIFSNTGNAAGIVGSIGSDDNQIYTSTIEKCVNKGYIHSTGNGGTPSCGGIVATIQFGDNISISNCYNVNNIEGMNTNDSWCGVGGILGVLYNNAPQKPSATINNCYNVGNIKNSYSSNNAGHVIGYDDVNNSSVSNCYYLDTALGSNINGGTALTEIVLKGYANTLGEAFTTDTNNKNNSFPILKWE